MDATILIDAVALRYAKPNYTTAALHLGISKSYLSKLRSGAKPMTPQLKSKIQELLA